MITGQKMDLELSTLTIGQIAARNKACYLNAWRAVNKVDNLLYAEGVAIIPEWGYLVLEHAWCQAADGRVVEVTPIWLEHRDTIYRPGLIFTRDAFVDIGVMPVFQSDRERLWLTYMLNYQQVNHELYSAMGFHNLLGGIQDHIDRLTKLLNEL